MTAEQIVKVCKKLKLSPNQVLSMYYTSPEINRKYPLVLDIKEENDLFHRGLCLKNKPTKKYLNLVEDILNDIPKNAKTIQLDERYQNIIIGLSKALDINPTDKTKERINKFFQEDDRLIDFYLTWLYLFPTSSDHLNKGWEYLFGVKYDGVPLRKVIDSNLRNFKRIAYNKDIGVYIIATYMYIRSHIKDGKCFIPKITNFISEQEDVYAATKEQLDPLTEYEVLQLFELNNTEAETVVPGMTQG